MGSIKTEEQQITKQRSGFFGTADGGAVGLINECKAAVARLFLKTSSDFAERGRIDFLEGPAGSPELVERTEKMIGIARDRFCHQRGLFVVSHSTSGEAPMCSDTLGEDFLTSPPNCCIVQFSNCRFLREHAFIANALCDADAIQIFQERNDDATGGPDLLPELARSGGSVRGN